MTKSISTKYALLTVILITAVTLVFVPVYFFVHKSMYIRLETNDMYEFCDTFNNSVSFSDNDSIEDYLDDYNKKAYTITIYDETQNRIFTTLRWRKNNPRNMQDKKIPIQHISEYSAEASPVYKEEDENETESILLRKIVKNNGKTYYIHIRETLKNIESVFTFTNEVLVIILIIYIIVCGILLFILTKGMTKSIRKLNDAVKRIAEKDYSVRYKGRLSNDEVGALASNFNDMADTIQDNINSIHNYNFLLKEDIDHLKEYENMRTKFVRNTTHELKTPLAIISSQVEMMNCAKDEEKRKYYFDSAMEEIQKMSELITSFLKYSANETEALKDKPQEINLSEKIEDLCQKISGNMQYKKLSFDYNIEPDLVLNFAESNIEYIFNNYIMNAIKHSPRGGKIRVELKSNDNIYKLSVYNDGTKIPEKKFDKIWTEFYSENKSNENVGLGLFIVKEVSLINHMDCGVYNHDNGVEFWFDFVK